jgi:hypothetical protein
MGGPGSGRWKDRARKTLESCLILDINRVSEKGWLRSGCTSTCQWINCNDVASINLRAESERVHLRYKVQVRDGKWEEVAETIRIIYLRCRFGGRRPFFICPGPGEGTGCGRRVIKLYLSRRYYLCRHCNQLAYASQYEQQWQRALRKSNKLKHRLGIDVDAEPLLDKPKGMWVRTYNCLLDEIIQAEMLAYQGQADMLKRWAQVKNDGS